MRRVDNGAASNLIPTVEKNDEDEDAENASETSAIRISKKAEGASQVSNDTPYKDQDNDVEEYVDDVTPSATPCDSDERSIEHEIPRKDDARLTPTAPPPDGDERSNGHALPSESVQAICRNLISMTRDENWMSQLMLKGLTEQELDVIRWQNPQLRRYYKDIVYKEYIFRDLETYQPGFYFVSDKNQKGEHETLHCTAIVVVPPGGKPRYFDSRGNVPDELRDRVEWSQLIPQKRGNTCAFHCLYVFDMWTKYSALSNLPNYSGPTLKEFMDGLYSSIGKPDMTPNDVAGADNLSVSVKGSYSEQVESSSEHSWTPEQGEISSQLSYSPEQVEFSCEHSCTPEKNERSSEHSCIPEQDESSSEHSCNSKQGGSSSGYSCTPEQDESSYAHSFTPEQDECSSEHSCNPKQGGSSSEHSCTPEKGESCSDHSCNPEQDHSSRNFDPDEKVMWHFKKELLPSLQQTVPIFR